MELLRSHRKILDNMARVLIERETIYTEEVDMLLEGATVEEVYAYMDKEEKAADKNPFDRFMNRESKAEAKPAAPAKEQAEAKPASSEAEKAETEQPAPPAANEEKKGSGEDK